jgi:hypothetical protein
MLILVKKGYIMTAPTLITETPDKVYLLQEMFSAFVYALQNAGIAANTEKIQPKTMTAINVTSEDYEDTGGFLVYIPESFSGNIVATPYSNDTAVTFTSYATGDYLRGGAVFKAVTTDTATKTGLEAWK